LSRLYYEIWIVCKYEDCKGRNALVPTPSSEPSIKNYVQAKKNIIRGIDSRLEVKIFVEGTKELAHEFDHTYQFALDPTDYLKKNKSTRNCQNYLKHPEKAPSLSITQALEWQLRYEEKKTGKK